MVSVKQAIMTRFERSAPWTLATITLGLLVVVGAIVAIRALNDEPWSARIDASGSVQARNVYSSEELTFRYPADWTIEPERPGQNQALAISLRSPSGTKILVWKDADDGVSLEIPDAVAAGDEEDVEYLVGQLFPREPTLEY